MSEQQLDLLQLPTRSPAELGARSATIMRRDAGDASIGRILPEHLPDDLFGHGFALYLVPSINRAEYAAVGQAGRRGPAVDCQLDPGRHRNRAHATVLANEVNDAPTTIALLNVCKRERRHFRSSDPASEDNGS